MKPRKLLLVGVVWITAVAVGVAFLVVLFAPPLRPAADYSVTYSVSGQTNADAQLFQPLGMASRRYVLIPASPQYQYRWLVVDFTRGVAAIPLFGVTCPCGSPCIHRDQGLGVLLTDAKTEDHWVVSVTREVVHLSNDTLSVTLTRKQ